MNGLKRLAALLAGAFVLLSAGLVWGEEPAAQLDTQLDFTDESTPAVGPGYEWNRENNTLTLSGLDLTVDPEAVDDSAPQLTMPADAVIVLAEGSENRIANGLYRDNVELAGNLTIRGKGRLVLAGGDYSLSGVHSVLSVLDGARLDAQTDSNGICVKQLSVAQDAVISVSSPVDGRYDGLIVTDAIDNAGVIELTNCGVSGYNSRSGLTNSITINNSGRLAISCENPYGDMTGISNKGGVTVTGSGELVMENVPMGFQTVGGRLTLIENTCVAVNGGQLSSGVHKAVIRGSYVRAANDVAAYNEVSDSLVFCGPLGRVTGAYTLRTDAAVVETELLEVPEGSSLTVADGNTLDVRGVLAGNGALSGRITGNSEAVPASDSLIVGADTAPEGPGYVWSQEEQTLWLTGGWFYPEICLTEDAAVIATGTTCAAEVSGDNITFRGSGQLRVIGQGLMGDALSLSDRVAVSVTGEITAGALEVSDNAVLNVLTDEVYGIWLDVSMPAEAGTLTRSGNAEIHVESGGDAVLVSVLAEKIPALEEVFKLDGTNLNGAEAALAVKREAAEPKGRRIDSYYSFVKPGETLFADRNGTLENALNRVDLTPLKQYSGGGTTYRPGRQEDEPKTKTTRQTRTDNGIETVVETAVAANPETGVTTTVVTVTQTVKRTGEKTTSVSTVETAKDGKKTGSAILSADHAQVKIPKEITDSLRDAEGAELTLTGPIDSFAVVFDAEALACLADRTILAALVPYDTLLEQAKDELDGSATVFRIEGEGAFPAGKVEARLKVRNLNADFYNVLPDGSLEYRFTSGGVWEGWGEPAPEFFTVNVPVTQWGTFARDPAKPVFRFADVPEDSWYYDEARQMFRRGLMQGVDRTHFSPEEPVSRAMLVTMLHRTGLKPCDGGEIQFRDVPADAWFAEAVRWAAGSGVANGTGDGFSPDRALTREELAVMLCRLQNGTPDGDSLSAFSDADEASEWAVDALSWCIGSGILKGRSAGGLEPAGTVSRAEAAAMLARFLDAVKQG